MRRVLIVYSVIVLSVIFPLTTAVTNYSERAVSGGTAAVRSPFFSNVDVLIDVGHGGVDCGTRYGELYEKDINLKMSKLTYTLMREKGLRVLCNRINDYALSGENSWLRSHSRHRKDLAQRSHLANDLGPKAVISIHVNWAKHSRARGPIILHQKNQQSRRLAECLQASLNKLYGTSNKAKLGKSYHMLRHVRPPSVIIEMGFITNPADREQMTQPEKQRELAEAIVAGVQAYLGQA
ncbi:N-acetylmuramoyl-L-alanine amidase family protein [Paenibacillus xerothermodurans]|nr:N-acetylmuramoyl-L-alanine amidase [Paenibacillus xerothermodurans]